jgi:hypothetical protein
MTDVQPDTEIPPDLQALIDDLAAEGRTAFERECDDCGVRFIPKQTWGALLLLPLSAPGLEEARREEEPVPDVT